MLRKSELQIQKLQNKISILEIENKKLVRQNNSFKASIKNLEIEKHTHKKENEELRKIRADLQNRLEDGKLRQEKEKKYKLEKQIKGLNKKMEKLEVRYKSKIGELVNLRRNMFRLAKKNRNKIRYGARLLTSGTFARKTGSPKTPFWSRT